MSTRHIQAHRVLTSLAIALLAVATFASPVAAGKGGVPGGPGGGGGGGGGDDTTAEPVPASMASLGDSITRAFNACGWYVDCTSRSWSTGGGNDAVDSHFERLRALDATMSTSYNDARTGAVVADLPGQAQSARNQGAGYVTVLIGANDACTSSESTMTSVATFRSHVSSALSTLDPDGRDVNVYVSSIPDIHRLWEIGKDSGSARSAWSAFDICQSMLANPQSTAQADVDRRQRVRQRVIDFNAALESECAAYTNCRYDGGAVFGYQFQFSQMSGWDYFHPNESGQAVLAEVSWSAGFDWAAAKKGGGKGRK